MQSVSIIGVGRVGGALALALPSEKYKVVNLFTRNGKIPERFLDFFEEKRAARSSDRLEKIDEDIVFITTQDTEIKEVAERLSQKAADKETFVFHTSGALSSEALSVLSAKGYEIGSLHPLASISDAALGARRFRGAYFCVEGTQKAVEKAKEIAEDLGGNPFSIPTDKKPLYHASAVIACGHLVALLETSFQMFSKCGVSASEAKKIFMPLIKSTLRNLEEQDTAKALTGTFARADIETFERHLEIMKREVSSDESKIYLLLGKKSLDMIDEISEPCEKTEEFRKKIIEAEKNIQMSE